MKRYSITPATVLLPVSLNKISTADSENHSGYYCLREWKVNGCYQGTDSVTNDGTFNINFDDGDKGKVSLNQIRLRN